MRVPLEQIKLDYCQLREGYYQLPLPNWRWNYELEILIDSNPRHGVIATKHGNFLANISMKLNKCARCFNVVGSENIREIKNL
jgi:hypothetical protein